MTRQFAIGATAVLLAAASITFFIYSGERSVSPEIAAIISTPQTYDGEYLDRLVALGPPAVPDIGDALNSGLVFPYKYAQALNRIGDDRGADAIVQFLRSREPFADHDESYSNAEVFLALHGIATDDSIDYVHHVLRQTDAHVRVRLAAAELLATAARGSVAEEGREFVMEAYEKRSSMATRPNEGLMVYETIRSLARLDTRESNEIVVELIEGWMHEPNLLSIRDVLVGYDDESVMRAVAIAVTRPDLYSLPTRNRLALGVVEARGDQGLLTPDVTEALIDESVIGGWPSEDAKIARRADEMLRQRMYVP